MISGWLIVAKVWNSRIHVRSAMSSSDNKVVVSGIRGLSEESIVMFLESRRHCPNGGNVIDHVQLSEDKLVVIFEDNQVANRLDKHLTLLDGTKISVEPYREYMRRKSLQTVSNTFQHSADSCSSSQRSEGTCRSNSLDASRRESHESHIHESSPTSKHSENLVSTSETQVNPKIPPTPFPRKAISEVPRTVKTFPFPREKLKLMKLIWEMDSALSSSCKCVVRFDKQMHTVILEGAIGDITAANNLLYGMSLAFAIQRVDVHPQIKRLLSTDNGENWLTEDFRKQDFAALVYVKDGTAYLIARDKDTLISADKLLNQFISTQNISFDDSHACFLRSTSWSQTVQAIEAPGLICMHTDHSAKAIEVAGRSSDVDLWAAEIRELLKKNQTYTRTIKHTIEVVRLLKKQESSINKDIYQGASISSIELQFICQEGVVKVIGLLDEVLRAEDIIRNKYIKTICYDTHQICTPGLTMEMFRARSGKQRDMIDLLENRHNCVIEVRGGGNRSAMRSQQKADSPSDTSSTGIEVTLGNIVQFKADVLVNTVADESLEKGGVVLKQFLEAGAPKLKQELQKIGIPQIFGSDVVATDAYGSLKAKFIFHAAIRKYQNQDSIEKLHNLIKKCLEMAAQRKASTIAFPAFGRGRLAFSPQDVIECFVQAKQTTKTTIKIFIVAVDQNIHTEFKSHLSKALSETFESGWLSKDERHIQPSVAYEASRNVIVFHINTPNKGDPQLVKNDLIERLDEMVDDSTIKDEVIKLLDDSAIAGIRDLQTSAVAIDIDRRSGVIKMEGDRLKIIELKMLIPAVIQSLAELDRYPEYWTNYSITDDSASKIGVKRVKVNPKSPWHAEVSHLVMGSWDQKKVGVGRDAKGLGQHTIKIRNIYCIENPTLLEKYMAKRGQMSGEASQNKFSPVKGLRNEQEIVTMGLGLRHLYSTLTGAVNEAFLLHGTKREKIDMIDSGGLDTRICGDETLFGVGSYCAESSTKADQYADMVGNRVALGQPLYMYVCRVLLGKPYVCDDPKNVKDFKRPPCMQEDCHRDRCSHPPTRRFDSIVGTHRPNPTVNGRLHFREFVVFHPEQSYPDFLIEYERVKYP